MIKEKNIKKQMLLICCICSFLLIALLCACGNQAGNNANKEENKHVSGLSYSIDKQYADKGFKVTEAVLKNDEFGVVLTAHYKDNPKASYLKAYACSKTSSNNELMQNSQFIKIGDVDNFGIYYSISADEDIQENSAIFANDNTSKQEYIEMAKYTKDFAKTLKIDSAPTVEKTTKIPNFEGKDLKGNDISQDIFSKADYTVLNVWATYCEPCINEMDDLEKWSKELPKNAQLVGYVGDVNGFDDQENLNTAKSIYEKLGCTYTSFIAPGSFKQDIGVTAYPSTYIIDKEGNFVSGPIMGAKIDEYKKALSEAMK